MSKYKVAEGTQVNHGGVLYGEGETLEADEQTAQEWVARGYVAEVEDKPKKGKKGGDGGS